jgi:minor extracellular serine protease Vpr
MSSKALSYISISVLIFAVAASPAMAQQHKPKTHERKTAIGLKTRVKGGTSDAAPVSSLPETSNHYALFLEDPPLASRFATSVEMRSAPALNYERSVESKQQALIHELHGHGITVTGSVSTLLNAVFVAASPAQVAELEHTPGVAGVRRMRQGRPALNDALQLLNAPAAWSKLGGQQNGGAGIKIGILDTGIDQTHPAFEDSSLRTPAGFPLCTAGHPEDCAYTNGKVIVARSYARMIAAGSGPANSMPDDYSPRDRDGHGTAVASAAAGNTTSGTVTFTGMAPKAYLGNYKVYGSPNVNDVAVESAYILAINDAVKDGMDIINISASFPSLSGPLDIGSACGLTGSTPCDPIAAACEAASKAGVLVVVSAGNNGSNGYLQYPTFNSITSPATAPSVISVGATINKHVFQPSVTVLGTNIPANLKNLTAWLGDSFFYPSTIGASQAPLVDVTQLGDDGFACSALPAGYLSGVYALIEVGSPDTDCGIADKVTDAANAGAIGVVFYLSDSSDLFNPEGITFYAGPVVIVSNTDGVALKSYIAGHRSNLVQIDAAGIEQDVTLFGQIYGYSPDLMANQVAGYSSFGPATDGSVKPELVATGGFDPSNVPDSFDTSLPAPSGLYVAAQNYDPYGFLFSASRYGAADGTSFSAPLAAGAAALVKQAHPGYTVAQIKSALVNSASSQASSVDDFGNPVDVAWVGAGLLNAGAAVSAPVTAEPATASFGFVTSALPSGKPITVTNKGTAAVTLAVSVTQNTPSSGTNVSPSPTSLSLAPGAAGIVTITVSGTIPPAGEYSGFTTLTGGGVTLNVPYMYVVASGVAAQVSRLAPRPGYVNGPPNQDVGPAIIQVVDSNGAPVAGSPVAFSVDTPGDVTFKSVPGKPACSPGSSTSTTTCPTDRYGNAYVEVVLGPKAGELPTVSATAVGVSIPIVYYISLVPAITSAGVVNDANFKGPIAPGSYIAVFGSNLVDPVFLSNPNGDVVTPNPDGSLPISLDFVTVSFDVPAAGISVPGYMFFVSPGQANVFVPRELQGQSSVQVKVTIDQTVPGNVVTVPVATYTPAFLVSSGIVVAQDQKFQVITPSNPARRGQAIVLYANGLGPVTNAPASGDPAPLNPLSATTTMPVVMVGGQPAQVLFSGLTPGFAGLNQVNIIVPANSGTGSQSISLTIGGQTAMATLPVQ